MNFGRYFVVDYKKVLDSDGFWTEYTWYYDVNEDRHVFVYGDRDFYRPEYEDFDWISETMREAYEWFTTYE